MMFVYSGDNSILETAIFRNSKLVFYMQCTGQKCFAFSKID